MLVDQKWNFLQTGGLILKMVGCLYCDLERVRVYQLTEINKPHPLMQSSNDSRGGDTGGGFGNSG